MMLRITTTFFAIAMIFIEAEGFLRVVSVVIPPFVQRSSEGRFEGFCVDLINEITALTGDKYNMYLSPDGRYGTEDNGEWNGMIGEVVKKHADLAIADININEKRKEVVDFTEPILKVGISAIMNKSVSDVIKTWAQLANQTDVMYGTINSGSTNQTFQTSTDPIAQIMKNYMNSNSNSSVRSSSEAFVRVSQGNYVFIGESASLEYMTYKSCNLSLIESEWMFEIEYGFAMQKESPYLQSFNIAIKLLKANGKIDELKQKWWKSECL